MLGASSARSFFVSSGTIPFFRNWHRLPARRPRGFAAYGIEDSGLSGHGWCPFPVSALPQGCSEPDKPAGKSGKISFSENNMHNH
jgi:hypothetical protein